MKKVKNKAEMKNTFCKDCPEDPETCGKNPLDCMKEARLYFKLYDNTKCTKGLRKSG